MDYTALADELLKIRTDMLLVPAYQGISKMTMGEQFVLNYLATNDNVIHPKELSEKMVVSTARIAALLNRLEEKKMIRRYTDPEDNRQVIVTMTEEGKQEACRNRAEVISKIEVVLEKIGPEDAEASIRIQKKILRKCAEND